MSIVAHEVNFDGLVGPTHNYAGLSPGNLASQQHAGQTSHPKQAALQGLAKMKMLMDQGLKQAVLPPHPRPCMELLERHGLTLDTAPPHLLAAAYSAAAMWAANAATVCPSADAADGRVHFTPANMSCEIHRAIETRHTSTILRRIFADPRKFVHHEPVDAPDEGAANHTRLCRQYHEPGVQLFVFGRDANAPQPTRHIARHAREASAAVAKQHQVSAAIFAQQLPGAIDAGVFHNDVIAVGNRNQLFLHEQAWVDQAKVIEQLRRAMNDALQVIEIPSRVLKIEDAVRTYLFNSQLVTLPAGRNVLICPEECRDLASIISALPFDEVRYVDLRQSMRNGGGPACLRLRVVLTEDELRAVHPGVMMTEALHGKLTDWIKRHYRDELHPHDLRDPLLARESAAALDELNAILRL